MSGNLKKRPYLNFPGVFLSGCARADGLCAAGVSWGWVRGRGELPARRAKRSLLAGTPSDTETCVVHGTGMGARRSAAAENSA